MYLAASFEDTLASSYAHGSTYLSAGSRQQHMRAFLFGYPISRSLAPLLQKTLFKGVSLPWTYQLHETSDVNEFTDMLKQPDIVGCAITMPYKVKTMSLVDEVTEEGRVIGAINTVFMRKTPAGITRYIGTNTDCVGVREAFLQNYPDLLSDSECRAAMVIGGGGACRAAVYAMWKWLGASRIYIVNRLEDEVISTIESLGSAGLDIPIIHVKSVKQAEGLDTPALIVGTVPDYPPREPGEIKARSIANHFLARAQKGYILEMCYHPKPMTDFFLLGKKAGWRMIYGTEAMIWQGVTQQVLWAELPLDMFDMEASKKVMGEILHKTIMHDGGEPVQWI
ncbi:NAD(P)-binding protein [Penicillium daleae]|uniref:NAD(P)-binding protein n=1 Tax=Penicillium daleae TaxID=63821 RepID=A0AAD6CFG7_9EURO|nr:NAD(P)-binding protein [Penicillium daleae]KAJ5461906.1 NAD(P)-binding protein [Penicillium daleae]